jgi:hypothetical protein
MFMKANEFYHRSPQLGAISHDQLGGSGSASSRRMSACDAVDGSHHRHLYQRTWILTHFMAAKRPARVGAVRSAMRGIGQAPQRPPTGRFAPPKAAISHPLTGVAARLWWPHTTARDRAL